MKRDYAVYCVALKILLKKGNKVLFLKTKDGKYFDLPGGRIDNVENKIPLHRILDREIREELGNKVKYKLGKPLFQYRTFSHVSKLPIFLTVYEGRYISRRILLSFEHSQFVWLNPRRYHFQRKDFYASPEFDSEEYKSFMEYFKSM